MKKILIVDDSVSFRAFLKISLEIFKDVVVIEAINGEDALEKAKEHLLELVFLDYHMPRMDGGEFLKKFKAQKQFTNVPIVMLTAAQKRIECYSLGVAAYIKKPFQIKTLIEVVQPMIPLRAEYNSVF